MSNLGSGPMGGPSWLGRAAMVRGKPPVQARRGRPLRRRRAMAIVSSCRVDASYVTALAVSLKGIGPAGVAWCRDDGPDHRDPDGAGGS
jgi:hypothetical protein